MTLDKAGERIGVQVGLGSGYNRNTTRLVRREVQIGHGQDAVDMRIREFDLETVFGLTPGTEFSNVV